MRTEAVARGVDPDEAWAWWTDFREGGEDHRFLAWGHPERRIEELEDGTLRLTETGRFLGFRLLEVSTVELARPRVRFDVRNNFGRFWGQYRFLPHEGGTRVEVAWEQEPVRWLRLLGPLGRWAVKMFIRWDLRQHLRELERGQA